MLHTFVNFKHTKLGIHSPQRPDRKMTSLHGLTGNFLPNNIQYSTNSFIDGGIKRGRYTSLNIMRGIDTSSSHPMKISVHKIKFICVIEPAKCSCDVLMKMRQFYRISYWWHTHTHPFAGQDVPKIPEIVRNLEPISSDSSLIPWILCMFASCVKWNLLLGTFHLFVKCYSNSTESFGKFLLTLQTVLVQQVL